MKCGMRNAECGMGRGRFGVRRVLAALARRLVAVARREQWNTSGAFGSRQQEGKRQAARTGTSTATSRLRKAVTSHRTPKRGGDSPLAIRDSPLPSCRDAVRPAQIRAQRLGYQHAAVRLLIRFNQRYEKASERGAGAVEQVRELVVPVGVLVAEVHPAGLKLIGVRATRHFEVGVLAGRPDLDIVGLRRSESAGSSRPRTGTGRSSST